jgi:hypothetical protein
MSAVQAAACALWLDIPLVTHDRDLEGISDLRVLTVHGEWRVGEETTGECASRGIWTGESASRWMLHQSTTIATPSELRVIHYGAIVDRRISRVYP